ncbi:MAG: hypothetical protein AB9869_16925 [Verrucomicrobiia bacterium]
MKRNLVLIASAFLVCAAALSTSAQGRRFAQSNVPLTDAAKAALVEALAGPDGEYAARAEYEAILSKFGAETLPYAHLIKAEENHIAALKRQCERFGVEIPEDTYWKKVRLPETLADAAKAGILAEEANDEMYQELLAAVKEYPSLERVFTQLRTASLERHLPALKAAAANGGSLTAGSCNSEGCMRQMRAGNGRGFGQGCPWVEDAQTPGPNGRQQRRGRGGW